MRYVNNNNHINNNRFNDVFFNSDIRNNNTYDINIENSICNEDTNMKCMKILVVRFFQ